MFAKNKIYPSLQVCRALVFGFIRRILKLLGVILRKEIDDLVGEIEKCSQFATESRGASYLTHGKVLYTRYFSPRLAVHSADSDGEFQEGTAWCTFFSILCCTTKNCINKQLDKSKFEVLTNYFIWCKI